MITCPVIVIGHVDHGKTSLVEAITGIKTDRLPEEKARGLSIVPGFAHRCFDGVTIDFIDAPGHSDFIRAMISGASGARAALLVISAVDGVEAQTIEHIQIATALGIEQGIVAVSKSDLFSASEFPQKESGLRVKLAGTPFGEAPLVFCSSQTGFGMDDLAHELSAIASEARRAAAPQAAFFPIDRVFVAEGHGTVVTGTLLGAPLQADETLEHPANGNLFSIRRIQVRGEDTPVAQPGERTALNLRGVKAEHVKPGDVLCAPDSFVPSLQVDVFANSLARLKRPIRNMDQIRVHFGSAHSVATVRLLKDREIVAGGSGFAQLRFDTPVCMFAGQRIILRSLSPAETLGGGTVLDPAAPLLKARKSMRMETLQAAADEDVTAIAFALAKEGNGATALRDICRLARRSETDVWAALEGVFLDVAPQLLSPSAALLALQTEYASRLKAFHNTFPLKLRAPRVAIADPKVSSQVTAFVEERLVAEGRLILTPSEVSLPDYNPQHFLTESQKSRLEEIVTALKKSGLSPPAREGWALEGDDRDLLALLVHSGEIIQLTNVSLKQTVWLHTNTVAAAALALKEGFPDQSAFTTSEARALLMTSRKYIVPLLEHFDETGLTVRRGDVRYIR